MTTVNNTNALNAATILRGLSNAGATTANPQADFAQKAINVAQKTDNKSATTVLLENFTKIYNGDLNGQDSSNITADQADAFLISKKNVFKSDEGQAYLKEIGYFYQDDIFSQMASAEGGVKYGDADSDNLIKAALNFAQADIDAIENACISWVGEGQSYQPSSQPHDKSGILGYGETGSYSTKLDSEDFKALDINGKTEGNGFLATLLNGEKGISAEEYASYMLLADGINGELDGIITEEDVEAFKMLDDETLAQQVKNIYENYYD